MRKLKFLIVILIFAISLISGRDPALVFKLPGGSILHLCSAQEQNEPLLPEEGKPETPEESEAEKTDEDAFLPASLAASENVTMDFKDADIRNVLKIISYKSRVNIVATPEVMGNVTIKLQDVPWEKALDTIVKTYGFGYEWLGNKVIMVSTLERLSQQRQAEEEASLKEPLDTQTFPLNFSKAEDIKTAVEKLVSERGKITLEQRTNTLVITDAKSKLIKIGEVIRDLDKATPQVMIEAKIIEATLGSAEKLGIDWTMRVAVSGSARPTTFPFQTDEAYEGTGKKMLPKVQVPDRLDVQTTTALDEAGNPVTTTTETLLHKLIDAFPEVTSSAFQFGALDFSQVKAVLEVLSSRSDTKILSNPRITTLNNQEAKILVGTVVPIPNYEYSKDTGTRVVSGYTEQQIGVGLTVTPSINEKDYITLNLNPTIDEITGWTGPNNERPIISTRNAETKVMIRDGQTLVIGGLISEKKLKSKKKIPILGDIPILDYIFSKKEDTIDKTELLIFVTPHIIKEAMSPPAEVAKLEKRLLGESKEAIEKKEKITLPEK